MHLSSPSWSQDGSEAYFKEEGGGGCAALHSKAKTLRKWVRDPFSFSLPQIPCAWHQGPKAGATR